MGARSSSTLIQPDEYIASRHNDASVFADAVIAFILGIVDWERTGTTGRVTLDELVGRVSSAEAEIEDPA